MPPATKTTSRLWNFAREVTAFLSIAADTGPWKGPSKYTWAPAKYERWAEDRVVSADDSMPSASPPAARENTAKCFAASPSPVLYTCAMLKGCHSRHEMSGMWTYAYLPA
eukprot:1229392-Pyramimonas_sp.AAC.2